MIKLSLITITYNSAETLEDTFRSVFSQTYGNIEYIVVDGGSKDGTLTLIEKYKSKIHKHISEKDSGLYDALNKGIAMAEGDIIGILHSDDFFTHERVLENVVAKMQSEKVDGLYADLYYVDRHNTDKIIRKWKSGTYSPGSFLNGWMPPHPAFFVRKELYERFGAFNLKLKSAADYELMLRFIHKHQITLAYLPEFIVKMRVGGKSNSSLRNRWKANREDREAWRINGLTPRFYTLLFKPLRKLFQFF